MKKHLRCLVIALTLAALAGCATAGGLAPSASVTTAIQGWEHYFRIDAAPEAKPYGVDIEGYVYNQYGRPATVRLLAQALDTQNNVIAQKIAWVPGGVPQLSRGYFKIAGLPAADQYRVTVWDFNIIDTDSWHRRF
jgi:predicted small lipoprotein YifL